MLFEADAGAFVRGTVKAGGESFHDLPGEELEVGEGPGANAGSRFSGGRRRVHKRRLEWGGCGGTRDGFEELF